MIQELNLNTLGLSTLLVSVIGVVIYLLKDNRKQAVEVNAQFLQHMQQALAKEQSIHDSYSASIAKLAAAVEANTAAIQPIIESVKEMSGSVRELSESVKTMVADHHRDIEALVKDYERSRR